MGVFKDQGGKESMMRQLSFTLVWAGIIIAVFEVWFNAYIRPIEIHYGIINMFVGIGVSGKVGQTIFERKKQKRNSIETIQENID